MRRVVLKNLLATSAGQVLGAALNFATIVVIARSLGAERYGQYAYVLAFVGMFQLIASAGLEQILIREIAVKRDAAPRLVGVTRSLTWALSLATFALIVGVVQLTDADREIRLAMYVAGIGVLATIHAIGFGSVFRAFEEMEVNAVAFVLHKIVLLALVGAAARLDGGLLGMCLAFLTANLFQWFYLWQALARRHFRPRLRVDVALWWTLLRESVPLGVGAILRRVSWHVDVLILTAFGLAAAAGYFTASYKVIQAMNLIPMTLAQTLFPMLSRTARVRSEEFHDVLHAALKFLLCLSVPLTLVLAVGAGRIVEIAYGPSYAPSAMPLAITSLSLVFIFWTSLYPFLFTALGIPRYYTLAALVSLLVNALVDVALAPRLAQVGVSIGTLSGEVALFAVGSVLLARALGRLPLLELAGRPLLAGAGMAAVLYLVRDASLVVLVAGTVGALVVYGGLLLLLRAVTPEEIRSVAAVLGDWLRFRGRRRAVAG